MTSALFIVSTPQRRGAEVFAAALRQPLARLNVQATVVALANVDTAGDDDGGLGITPVGTKRWSPSGLRRLLALARQHDVLVSNGGTTLIPTMIVAAISRRPFIYRNIGDPTVWGAARFANQRIGTPLRRAAAIAALYPVAATEISARYAVDPKKIRVIPNAAPSDQFGPATETERVKARASLGLGDDRRWVGYVGALSEEKRPLLAIEAISRDPSLGLLIAGDGPLRSACEASAAQLEPGAVIFLGSIPDVSDLYAAVDAIVIPSRTEGIPGAAIEAGLSGVPVVASDVGGMGHVVRDGLTGILLSSPTGNELADALIAAIDQRDKFGPAAAELCNREFSMTSVAAKWADLITNVATKAL